MADLIQDREFGQAYGYVGLEELGRFGIDQVDNGVALNREAIQKTLDYTNARNEVYRSRISTDVSMAKEWYEMPGGGTLQDIDEHDNPLPRVQLSAYDVAFPIRGGGDATGTDRISRALMTFNDANRAVQQATLADKRWHINYKIAALLRNTSYPFLDRTRRTFQGAGSLTIQPLANGDSTQYINNEGSGIGADNHYLNLVGAITSTNNPFPQIYDELVEHAEMPGEVDVYVARDLVTAIEGMTQFHEPRDPNITYGSGESTVARGDKGIGDRYIGYVNECNIIRMNALPAGYMFAHNRDMKPLGYRQYPAASVQGLFQETHSPDGNHMETRFLRYGGYGVRNRVAAAVMQVNAASYTAPTLSMRLA